MSNELPPVLNRMLELWNGGEIDPAEVYARGCALDGGASRFDPEAVLPEIAALRSSFPDLRFTVDGSFASGNRHVLRLLATGTHTGEPFPTEIGRVPAAGQPIDFRGIEVFEIADDLIVDVWVGWNFAARFAALGARGSRYPRRRSTSRPTDRQQERGPGRTPGPPGRESLKRADRA